MSADSPMTLLEAESTKDAPIIHIKAVIFSNKAITDSFVTAITLYYLNKVRTNSMDSTNFKQILMTWASSQAKKITSQD